MVATITLGWLVLVPEEYRMLGRQVIAGSLFSSNFLLWHEAGYFDTAAEQKPLLHLWSLGVEEQFYLFWPLLLALLWRVRQRLRLAFALLLVTSYFLNVTMASSYPEAAFYFPLTRFWELLAGALLAIWLRPSYASAGFPIIRSKDRLPEQGTVLGRRIWYHVASLGGIILLFVAIAFQSSETSQAWRGVLPVLGTMMLIGAGPSAIVNQQLARKPIVFVGLISYSLYLWHWPLLAFIRIVEAGGNVATEGWRAAALLIAITASALTYYFIERPVRARGAPRLAVVLALLMILPISLGVSLHYTNGFAAQRGPWNLVVSSTRGLYAPNSADQCLKNFSVIYSPEFRPARDFCIGVGLPEERSKVIVVGDSHAEKLVWGLGSQGIAAYMLGRGGCLPLSGYVATSTQYSGPLDCIPTLDNILRAAVEQNPDVVILTGFFARAYDGRMVPSRSMVELTRNTIAFLAPRVHHLLIVLDVPELPFEPSHCIDRPFQAGSASPCQFPRAIYERQRRLYAQDLVVAAKGFANVSVVDPSSAFCDESRCIGALGSRLLYDDQHHLSADGAALLGRVVGNRLKDIR
jgi:peptidoglycan/LPS O-acetylase OafA/YrhL